MGFFKTDNINYNLFTPLSSKNRDLYSECILAIYRHFSIDGVLLEENRSVVQCVIEAAIREYGEPVSFDPDDEDAETYEPNKQLSVQDNVFQNYAGIVFRKLVRCGWLALEEDKDGKPIMVSIPRKVKELMRWMQDISTNNATTKFGGYVIQIHDILTGIVEGKFDRRPYAHGLLIAMEHIVSLYDALSDLYNNIRDSIRTIKDAKSFDIATKQLLEFLRNGTEGTLHDAQNVEAGNLSIRNGIKFRINDILESGEIMSLLAKDAMESEPSLQSEEMAYRHVRDMLERIDDSITGDMETKMRTIREIQKQYVESARIKLSILSSQNTSIEDVERMVTALGETSDEEFDDDFGHLFAVGFASKMSLEACMYVPKNRNYEQRDEDPLEDVPEDMQTELLSSMTRRRSNKYSIEGTNRYIRKKFSEIGSREFLREEDFSLSSDSEWKMFSAILLNHDKEKSEYNVEFLGDQNISVDGSSVPPVRISLKKGCVKER